MSVQESASPVSGATERTTGRKWPTLAPSILELIQRPYLPNDDHIRDPEEAVLRVENFLDQNGATIRSALTVSDKLSDSPAQKN